METNGIPAGRIYRAPEMLADPHFKARQSIVSVMHKTFGELSMQNVAPRLSDTPGQVRHAGPELGEHNDEILLGVLGMKPAEIEKLKAAGVV